MKKLIGVLMLIFAINIQAQTNEQGYYAHDGEYGKVSIRKDGVVIKELPMEDSEVFFTLKKGQMVDFLGRHKINKSNVKNKKWYKVYFTICNGKLVEYKGMNYRCKGEEKNLEGWIYSEGTELNTF